MIYSLLGELEIGRDGRLIDLPGGPTLIVLAALLVNANRRMSKAALIRAAWGCDEVSEAQLYKRVKAARDLLESIGRGGDLRTHSRFGYEIHVAEGDVDALQFQRLVREAAEAGAEHRTEEEIGYLRRALGLWRGPRPLSNVPSNAFGHERIALEQRHRRAAVRLFELELARGNHERILDKLILTAGYYPSDRRLCEQLMLTAHRSGHPADAAQAYERYLHALAEETGGEPDALLRTLHFAIAREDDEAIESAQTAVERRVGTPAHPVVAVPRQLPPAADLAGRRDLAAEVSWLLRREPRQAAPVVVVSGPGGIGKTALALRAAHACADRYPDGQLFMELRGGAADTSEVLAQFLRAFGLSRVPDAKAERLATFRTLLAERRVLVVLDDAAGGAQVADLVPASPHCAVLVTARQRLPELTGAHHVTPLEPLEPADATELFLRVVRDAGIDPEDDLDAVGRVVALCGGLPLALRVAGALRVHNHPRPTAELADRLARQGPDGFAYGELSVARTIGAGFERLDAGARQLFLGLGLLPLAWFGRWTADALLGRDGHDADAALSQLTASFMIQPVPAQMRYRFHDLTREYARRRALAEYPGDADAVADRVYRALLTLVRRAHAGLYGGDFEVVHGGVPDWSFAVPGVLAEVEESAQGWLERERANIRAAVGHCAALGLIETCWDLAVSAHEFYGVNGYFDDWQVTHTVALEACRSAGDRRGEGIVLACLNQPAIVASRRSDRGSGLADLERAVDLLTESGDRHGQAIAMRTLANALRRQGHLTRPLALFTEALFCYITSGDTVGQWQTLRFIGQNHLDLGQYAEARRVLEESENLAVELGGGRLVAQTRYWIGQTCLASGDIDDAQVAFDAVLDIYGEGGGVGRAYGLHGLGQVASRLGAYATAGQNLTEAIELAREGADAVLEGRTWLSVGTLRGDQKQPDEQIAALEQAVTVFAGCGLAYLEVRALTRLARVLEERGDAAAAAAARARIEDLYRAAGVPEEDRVQRR